MPRGARKDENVTKLLQDNGYFVDKRSFVGHGSDYVPHLFLHGFDKTVQREKLFRAGRRVVCAVCGASLTSETGEWHHTRNCDCLACSEVRCGQWNNNCHHHRTLTFKRKAHNAGKHANTSQFDATASD